MSEISWILLKKLQYIASETGYRLSWSALNEFKSYHEQYVNNPTTSPYNQISWDWHCGNKHKENNQNNNIKNSIYEQI